MRDISANNRTKYISVFKHSDNSHFYLLLSWIVFFVLYIVTENFIPAEACFVMHSKIDDIIPFCEWFLIPYVFWYFLVAGSLIYFAFKNKQSFKKLQCFIIITQVVAMATYVLFPNMQNLRPSMFERDNLLTRGVSLIYSFDTNTNVCPSLHVAYSVAVVSVWLKEKAASRSIKAFVLLSVILICLSTVFIKQHSVIDVICALVLCIFAETMVYGRYWKEQIIKNSPLY